MESGNVILARGLTKAYRLWSHPSARLTSPLLEETARYLPGGVARALRRNAQSGYKDFFALQDVNFEVRRGEAVGIVGRNGAGKSTLLQLIAGTLQPSAGSIAVHGRVAALLELGAGFNPEFTGTENVFLSGAVLGLSRAEMERRFDTVAAFANIGEFIDQPVKTYSSGMMMRLAFAVNTCVDPDILIVDEALSVGDAPFQAKCFRRLRQLIDQGVTLLFVSHDLGTVRSICSRALWLKTGRVEMWGDSKEVAKKYEKYCWAEQGVVAAENAPAAPATPTQPMAPFPANPAAGRTGTGALKFTSAFLSRESSQEPTEIFEYDETAILHCHLEASQDIDSEFVLSVRFRDVKGNFIYAAHDVSGMHRVVIRAGQKMTASLPIRLPLHHQAYSLHLAVFGFQDGIAQTGGAYDFTRAIFWDVIEEAIFINVRACKTMPLPGPVHVNVPLTYSVY